MKNLISATLLTLVAAPLFAEPACTPGETLKPVWEAIKAFEDAGGTVVSFKINDGLCYEVYGEQDGKKVEVFYDPNTAVELGRAE
jgi:hypothetical protein